MPRTSDRRPLLLDTHIWIWLEAGSRELSSDARAMIARALGGGRLRVGAISLWELALLASRSRISLGRSTSAWIEAALTDPGPVIEPLSAEVAVESCEMPDWAHRDPADRMLVATARVIGGTLMTRDRRILDYAAAGHVMAVRG